jgi:drug/metabolite transporter (DMT)-like permease
VDDLQGALLGLTAALAWGLTDTVATFASRRVGSLRATAGAQATSVIVLATLFVGTGATLPVDLVVVAIALVCGGLAAVAYLSFFTALRHGPITVVSPVVATYGGLTVVLSVIVLGESLAGAQALGVAIATTGVFLVSIAFERGLRSARPVGPGVAYAVAAVVLFAVVTVGLAEPIRAAGWLPVLLLARVGNASSVGVILAATRVSRPAQPGSIGSRPMDRRSIGLIIGAGLLDVAGLIAFALGIEIAPTWLIGITSSLGPVIAVIAGVVLFTERPRPIQWFGLSLVALSVGLIALG